MDPTPTGNADLEGAVVGAPRLLPGSRIDARLALDEDPGPGQGTFPFAEHAPLQDGGRRGAPRGRDPARAPRRLGTFPSSRPRRCPRPLGFPSGSRSADLARPDERRTLVPPGRAAGGRPWPGLPFGSLCVPGAAHWLGARGDNPPRVRCLFFCSALRHKGPVGPKRSARTKCEEKAQTRRRKRGEKKDPGLSKEGETPTVEWVSFLSFFFSFFSFFSFFERESERNGK